MRARWCNAAMVGLGLVALSCSGSGGGAPRLTALPPTTAAAAPAGEDPTTAVAPAGSTTSTVAPTTTTATSAPAPTTTVADTAPPSTVPFVDAPPTTSALGRARADVGVAYPFVLITRCGIAATLFDQQEWRNDPPLADPGTRPDGWNPSYEQGTMTLSSPDVAEFISADGLRKARYVPRPPDSPDLPACP